MVLAVVGPVGSAGDGEVFGAELGLPGSALTTGVVLLMEVLAPASDCGEPPPVV
jgi:hypothetical protein